MFHEKYSQSLFLKKINFFIKHNSWLMIWIFAKKKKKMEMKLRWKKYVSSRKNVEIMYKAKAVCNIITTINLMNWSLTRWSCLWLSGAYWILTKNWVNTGGSLQRIWWMLLRKIVAVPRPPKLFMSSLKSKGIVIWRWPFPLQVTWDKLLLFVYVCVWRYSPNVG